MFQKGWSFYASISGVTMLKWFIGHGNNSIAYDNWQKQAGDAGHFWQIDQIDRRRISGYGPCHTTVIVKKQSDRHGHRSHEVKARCRQA